MLEVKDPTRDVLRGFLTPLYQVNNDIDQLIKVATNITAKGVTNFNKLTKRFSTAFIKKFNNTKMPQKFSEAVSKYLKVASYFQSTQGINQRSLYQMLDPKVGTPSTMLEMSNLNKRLIDQIERMLNQYASGQSKTKSVEGALKPVNRSKTVALQRKIKITKDFHENVFSREMTNQKYFGYSILDAGQGMGALQRITLDNLKGRFRAELTRSGLDPRQANLKVGDQVVDIKTVDALTPSKTLIGGQKNQLDATATATDMLNTNLAIYEVNYRQQTRKENMDDKELLAAHQLQVWASSRGATVATRLTQATKIEERNLESIIDEKTQLSKPLHKTAEIRYIDKQKKLDDGSKLILGKIFDSSFETNPGNQGNKFMKNLQQLSGPQLSDLPYQAIRLYNKMKTNANMKYSQCYQKYMNLFQIEVFQGFETTTKGETVMLQPKFSKLQTYSQIGNQTLCRLVPYENSFLQLRQEELLQLPILNEYFIVET